MRTAHGFYRPLAKPNRCSFSSGRLYGGIWLLLARCSAKMLRLGRGWNHLKRGMVAVRVLVLQSQNQNPNPNPNPNPNQPCPRPSQYLAWIHHFLAYRTFYQRQLDRCMVRLKVLVSSIVHDRCAVP